MAAARVSISKRLRRIWKLFNKLDADPERRKGSKVEAKLYGLFDPDIEFVQPAVQVGSGTSRGREELRGAWDDWLNTWVEHRSEIEDIVERGDRALLLSRERLRAHDGMVVEIRSGSVFTHRDGAIVRWAIFLDQESARRAFEAG